MMTGKHIISIALLLLVGAGAAFFVTRSGSETQTGPTVDLTATAQGARPLSNVDIAQELQDPAVPPPGYVEYKNERYGFSFYHSPKSKITEYDEGGGAMTVTLENEQTVRGLQIFIVPYSESTITEERFHSDVPSGVRENVEPTTVGAKKIPAVTFISYDSVLGDTREVWFLHGGFLYEVTTFKGLGEWFAPLMQTWRFQ